MSGPRRVFRSKIGGLTPGFQILDGRGDRYVIKFDPVNVPELSSAAEVIATKLFFAIGYSVPENYIVAIDPEAGLTIEPGTVLEDEFGDESTLTRGQLRRRLRAVPRLDDGRVRVTASRYLAGRPIGPSATTGRAATIRTTSSGTRTGGSCGACGCSRPGPTTTTRAPTTPRTAGWRRVEVTTSAITCSTSGRPSGAVAWICSYRTSAFTTGSIWTK